MKYPKLRELKEAIRALIKGPYTTKFPYVPHVSYERFRGRSEFHKEYCIGCTACAQVCPAGAITIKDDISGEKPRRILSVRWDICIFCGQCQANCPVLKGIMLAQDFDLATTGKREALEQVIEKELVLCDSCGGIVAPYDQILWVAKRLGPLCFSNASLMLFYLTNLSLALKENASVDKPELTRADRIRVLCPRCRREAVLKS